MHIVIEALNHLIGIPKNQFDAQLEKAEKHLSKIDINDIPEEEFDDLFQSSIRELGKKDDLDLQHNALKLIAYLCSVEVLAQKYFSQYIDIYKQFLEEGDPSLYSPLQGFLEHIEEVFRDYTSRITDLENHPEYIVHIQDQMKEDMIELLFYLQKRETQIEKLLDPDSPDRTHELGIIPAHDTKNKSLRQVRLALDTLTQGILEKVMYDEEYASRVSSVDDELDILGRYQQKTGHKKEKDACGCGHHH